MQSAESLQPGVTSARISACHLLTLTLQKESRSVLPVVDAHC
jgi:hypothetical protein